MAGWSGAGRFWVLELAKGIAGMLWGLKLAG